MRLSSDFPVHTVALCVYITTTLSHTHTQKRERELEIIKNIIISKKDLKSNKKKREKWNVLCSYTGSVD